MSTSDITDITWSMMSDAGIDIDLVNRQPTQIGTDEYILIDGDTKVAFGPAVDVEGDGSTYGWDISTYDRVTENDGDEYWDGPRSQEWAETPADALRLVAAEVNPHGPECEDEA